MSSGLVNQDLGTFFVVFDNTDFTNGPAFASFIQKNLKIDLTTNTGTIRVSPIASYDPITDTVTAAYMFPITTHVLSYSLLMCNTAPQTSFSIVIGDINSLEVTDIIFEGTATLATITCQTNCFKIYFPEKECKVFRERSCCGRRNRF